MWTRGRLRRTYSDARPDPGMLVSSNVPAGAWFRGRLHTGGVEGLRLPPGGTGFGFAHDPSDPKTWRRPVRWT